MVIGIVLIESISDTLWSYKGNKTLKFTDIELIDINGDGLKDLVVTPDLFTSIGFNDWLYVFLGSEENIFLKEPYTYGEAPFEQSGLKPTSLAMIPNKSNMLSVSFGSPVRYAISFIITFKNI